MAVKDKTPTKPVSPPLVVSLADLAKPDWEGPTVISSLDLTSGMGKLTYLNTCSDADYRAEEHEGARFSMQDWICSRVHYEAREGEEARDGVRIVFLSPTGETMSCSSEAVARWLDKVRELLGDGPYDPPLLVALIPASNRAGRRTYKVRLYSNESAK